MQAQYFFGVISGNVMRFDATSDALCGGVGLVEPYFDLALDAGFAHEGEVLMGGEVVVSVDHTVEYHQGQHDEDA